MTRDEALISAALEMAARRINSDDMRWLSRCQVADAIRAIDPAEVLAMVGTVVTDGGSVAVCSICDIAGCHHIREAKAQPDHDAVARLVEAAMHLLSEYDAPNPVDDAVSKLRTALVACKEARDD